MRAALVPLAAAVILCSQGAAWASPPIVLSASPTQLTLLGSSRGAITVANPGRFSVHVAATTGEYSISPDGRVRVGGASKRSARSWLTISPKALDLAPGSQATITVASHVPRSGTPGDAHALVLVETKAPPGVKVGVRSRLGIGVLVRVGGELHRKLAITGARLAGRKLSIGLANRGNVNERLLRGQVTVRLRRGGRSIALIKPQGRNLLPGGRGVVRVALPRSLRGRVTAIVRVAPTAAILAGPKAPRARVVVRSFALFVRR